MTERFIEDGQAQQFAKTDPSYLALVFNQALNLLRDRLFGQGRFPMVYAGQHSEIVTYLQGSVVKGNDGLWICISTVPVVGTLSEVNGWELLS